MNNREFRGASLSNHSALLRLVETRQQEMLNDVQQRLRDAREEWTRTHFNEMPGMRLTHDQFCRLWHLERQEAERVISLLTASGFLQRDGNNRYGRTVDGGR